MKPHFRRIGLIGKSADGNVSMTLRALTSYLVEMQVDILVDDGINPARISPRGLREARTRLSIAPLSLPPVISPSWWVVTVPC